MIMKGYGEIKLVGMAETAVKESVSRIQAALRNSGYRWPGPKVTINLAPADVKKHGPLLWTLPSGWCRVRLMGGPQEAVRETCLHKSS